MHPSQRQRARCTPSFMITALLRGGPRNAVGMGTSGLFLACSKARAAAARCEGRNLSVGSLTRSAGVWAWRRGFVLSGRGKDESYCITAAGANTGAPIELGTKQGGVAGSLGLP